MLAPIPAANNFTVDGQAKITLPWIANVGARWAVNDQWTLNASVSRVGWGEVRRHPRHLPGRRVDQRPELQGRDDLRRRRRLPGLAASGPCGPASSTTRRRRRTSAAPPACRTAKPHDVRRRAPPGLRRTTSSWTRRSATSASTTARSIAPT
ncbi:outer membrane protein transport protein [Caulobacter segnis]